MEDNKKCNLTFNEAYDEYFEVAFHNDMTDEETGALHREVIREIIEGNLKEYAQSYVEGNEMAYEEGITDAFDMGENPQYERQKNARFENFLEYLDECFYKDLELDEDDVEDIEENVYGGWEKLREVQEEIFFSADEDMWDKTYRETLVARYTQEGTIQDLKDLAKAIAEADDWKEADYSCTDTIIIPEWEDKFNLYESFTCFGIIPGESEGEDTFLSISNNESEYYDTARVDYEGDDEERLYQDLLSLASDFIEYALEHYTDQAILNEVFGDWKIDPDEPGWGSIHNSASNYDLRDFEPYRDEIEEILGVTNLHVGYDYYRDKLTLDWGEED